MRRWVIGSAIFLYFLSTLWLTAGVPKSFLSPDENANFTFAEQFRAEGSLAIDEPRNAEVGGILHGRSVVAVGEALLPGSFLGLPLAAGTLGFLTFGWGTQLFTPIALILALLAWYGIIRRLFGNTQLAMVASTLVALHPGVWYYGARTMMHNVPFVAFLIFGAWWAIAQPIAAKWQRKGIDAAVAGALLGIALCMRTSEALWVAVAAAVCVAIAVQQKIRLHPAWFAMGFGAVLLSMFALNTAVYGGPLTTGYTVHDVPATTAGESAATVSAVEAPQFDWSIVGKFLLPFGFHEYAMLRNIWNYGIALYPWMSLLALAGIVLALRKGEARPWRILAVLTLLLAAWLGTVYGSWVFNDNPDPHYVTIGDSHVRYWLPLFVLASPFAARALLALAKTPRTTAGVIAVLAILSGSVVFGGLDGLWRGRSVLFTQLEKREAVMETVEDDAVIIVDRADKFLFPYVSVVQPLRSDATFAAMPKLAATAPLYYFGIPLPESDMRHMNDVRLAPLQLHMEPVLQVEDEMLYRITPAP